jgi:hypothetical protein
MLHWCPTSTLEILTKKKNVSESVKLRVWTLQTMITYIMALPSWNLTGQSHLWLEYLLDIFQ